MHYCCHSLCSEGLLAGSGETAHRSGYPFQPRDGLKAATRGPMKELLLLRRERRTGIFATTGAAFSILGRLEVTHVNFIFLLFAHISFLSCVYSFGLCQSRRIVAVPLRPSHLGIKSAKWISFSFNASDVELTRDGSCKLAGGYENAQPLVPAASGWYIQCFSWA